MQAARALAPRTRAMLRVVLSHYVANGIAVALGLALISALVHVWLGPQAGAAASVGVIVASPPDMAAPRRGKLWQMLPAPLLGIPLFLAVQLLHGTPLALGLLLVPATFLAFLAMAWGRRGIPVAIAVMFSMLFSMATHAPASSQQALRTTADFALGAGLYLLWAVAANHLLNARYRVQSCADLLYTLAALMRAQASLFSVPVSPADTPANGQLLALQAALADQLQSARDIVLESPDTPRRQQLAGMLAVILEMRDHLLACELDLDALRAHPRNTAALLAMRRMLGELTRDTARLADALLLGRTPPMPADRRSELAGIRFPRDAAPMGTPLGPTPAILARGMANRLGHLNDELRHLTALARGDIAADLAVVRANWQMFVSPTAWSFAPLLSLWRWDAPPLRHAIRAALAIAAGYAVATALPWGSHDYWILLTIVSVLRGSLAQTLERRNLRVAGTLLGCLLALGLLALHPSPAFMLLSLTLAQAIAHGFAVRRYLITAIAATVLGLVQAHMLNSGIAPAFALVERVTDTLIGAALAWAFCYVLPSWERTQIPALVARTLRAQALHAQLALRLGQTHPGTHPAPAGDGPELHWRLARREAFDSLCALVQATQRSLSEPRAVRPPLAPLEHLQAHGYQLMAQLSAVKAMLVLRRDRLRPEEIETPLRDSAQTIHATLTQRPDTAETDEQLFAEGTASGIDGDSIRLPDPFDKDLTPWLLRRLDLANRFAWLLREDAQLIGQALRQQDHPAPGAQAHRP